MIRYKNYLKGFNTDWFGIFYPIKKTGKKFNKACILGAGGTSKAAIYALERLGITDIILWNRSAERIESFKWPCPVTTNLQDLYGINLIVSTLPGTSEIDLNWISENSVVFDAAYFPEKTCIGQQAEKVGARYINGKEMYLYMARRQFMLFTGRNVTTSRIQKNLVFRG